jgi:hypothetical protein
MVGQQTSLAELTGRYVGKSFSECSCMELAYSWYTEIGVDVPFSFDGLTVDNYFPVWEKDRKAVINIMLELFSTLGEPVADFTRLQRHDLLAVQEKNNIYAAIYLENSMAITSNIAYGVRVFFLGKRHRVIAARRFSPCRKR